jgi:Flp pilus assembly protein CpaB
MKPRNLLIIAVVLGLAGVGLLQLESWRTRGGTVYVFKAIKDLPPAKTLAGAVEVVGIPGTTYATMRSQVPTAELQAWVSSTPLVRAVHAGDTITFDMLQKSASPGLKISPGMRAASVEVQAGQAVGYLIRPGDYVDVLGTLVEEVNVVTRHLLQAKLVLAVDQQYRLEDSAFLRSNSYSTVTLEVTPAEAEIIEAYRSILRNGFTLSLRGRGDLEILRTPNVELAGKARK